MIKAHAVPSQTLFTTYCSIIVLLLIALIGGLSLATGGIEGRRFIEYQGTRRYDDLLSFALGLMPNFVARVESEEAWVQANG